ncbi:unnamed protein product, partial [Mesorhabditis belari]|uniref:Uncharacterized protein n=1 Tax=Mesorhabditis belari TaxID=2138241 RepID=A0AAF3E7Y2_9BILA
MSIFSVFFLFLLLPHLVYVQFLSTRTLGLRVPGLCPAGCFDCGFGRRCVSITAFHDGRPDCPDGSDEWCLPGFIKCGSYCVEPKYLSACLFNPRCDGKQNQPAFCAQSKEKLCREKNKFPCKSYGECVPWSWVRDGKAQCIDGSDENDADYISVLERGWKAHLDKVHQGFGNDTNPLPTGYPLPPIPPGNELEPFHPLSPILPEIPVGATTLNSSDPTHISVNPQPKDKGGSWQGNGVTPIHPQIGRPSTESPVIFIPGRWSNRPPTAPTQVTHYPGEPAIVHPTLIPFDYTPSQIQPQPDFGQSPFVSPPAVPLSQTRSSWSQKPWIWPPPYGFTHSTQTLMTTTTSTTPLSVGITVINPVITTINIHGHHGGRILTTSTTTTTTTTRSDEQITDEGFVNDTTISSTIQAETSTAVNMIIPLETMTIDSVIDESILRCEKAFKEEVEEGVKNEEVLCKCPPGQMADAQGKCNDSSISTVIVNKMNPPCNASTWDRFDQTNLGQFISLKLKRLENVSGVCVVEAIPDGQALVRIICQPWCNLELVNLALLKEANISTPFDSENSCTCKEGTNDTEPTRAGRNCWGIPDEDNCILLFNVCLVFWALCLIGAVFLLPLLYMCFSGLLKRWRKRKRKISPNVAFNTKPTVITIDNFEQTNTARLLRQTLGPRAAGVLASGRALQNMQLKSILKPSDSGIIPLSAMEDVETEIEPNTQPPTGASTTLPSPADNSPQATEPPSARASSAPPPKEEPAIEEERRSLPKSGSSPRLAELASSPPLMRSQSVVHQRVGSAQSAGAVVAGAVVATAVAKAQAQTAPASPVFSIRVPAASKTAPPTPKMKEDPPSFPPLSLSSSMIDLQRQDLISSPAPSLASRASRHGQPTIWETYRVLGDQYAKPESARPESSDSLDKLIKDRYPTPPEEDLLKTVTEEIVEPIAALPSSSLPQAATSQAEKLAEMLGVSVSEGAEAVVNKEDELSTAQVEATPPTTEPKIDELATQEETSVDEAALLALSAQGGVIGGPTFTRKRLEELRKERSRLPIKKEIFIPKGIPHRKPAFTMTSTRSQLPQISSNLNEIYSQRQPRRVLYQETSTDEGSDMETLRSPNFPISAPTTMRETKFMHPSTLLKSPLSKRRTQLRAPQGYSSDVDIPMDSNRSSQNQLSSKKSSKRLVDPPEIRKRGDRSRIKPIKMPPNLAIKVTHEKEVSNPHFLPSTISKENREMEPEKERSMHSLSTHFRETTTTKPLHGILINKRKHRNGGTVSARECSTGCQWCHHGESDSSAYFMPGMRSRRDPGYYSARNHSISPARSMSNVRNSHIDLSPYFDLEKDSKKPHKEGLWWGHAHA